MNEQKTLNYYDAGGAYEEDFVLSKEEIKKCRHKSEQRWYRGLCVINGLILLLAVVIIAVYTPLHYKRFCNLNACSCPFLCFYKNKTRIKIDSCVHESNTLRF